MVDLASSYRWLPKPTEAIRGETNIVRNLLRPRQVGTEARTIGVPAGQGATILEALVVNGTDRPKRPAMRQRSIARMAPLTRSTRRHTTFASASMSAGIFGTSREGIGS